MTDKQRATSRANGAKSRGPITEAGRQRASRNALKHGFCSELVVLTNESEPRFQDHRRAYIDRFQPADPVELDLVEELISTSWRIHRIWGVETAAIEREMNRITPELEAKYVSFREESRLCVAMTGLMGDSRDLTNIGRYESRMTRHYHRALQSLLKLQAANPSSTSEENDGLPHLVADPEPPKTPLPPAPQQISPNEPGPHQTCLESISSVVVAATGGATVVSISERSPDHERQ